MKYTYIVLAMLLAGAASALDYFEIAEPATANKGGLTVQSITPNGPATESTLAVGDRIVGMNGKAVYDESDYDYVRCSDLDINSPVTLTIVRNSRIETITITYPAPLKRLGVVFKGPESNLLASLKNWKIDPSFPDLNATADKAKKPAADDALADAFGFTEKDSIDDLADAFGLEETPKKTEAESEAMIIDDPAVKSVSRLAGRIQHDLIQVASKNDPKHKEWVAAFLRGYVKLCLNEHQKRHGRTKSASKTLGVQQYAKWIRWQNQGCNGRPKLARRLAISKQRCHGKSC